MERKTLDLANCEIVMDEVGSFEGYAATFGNVDSYGDTILKGAFIETLAKNGMPKMFILHKSYELPIGKWIEAKEDDKGLFVKGELTPELSMAEDVGAAMKHGTLDGLSIGYALKKGDYTPSTKVEGGRIIKKVSLLAEISPVTFPADSYARIDMASVKSDVEGLETIRDFEGFLRDSGSFSKSVVELLITRAKVVFGQGELVKTGIDEAAINKLVARLDNFKI